MWLGSQHGAGGESPLLQPSISVCLVTGTYMRLVPRFPSLMLLLFLVSLLPPNPCLICSGAWHLTMVLGPSWGGQGA